MSASKNFYFVLTIQFFTLGVFAPNNAYSQSIIPPHPDAIGGGNPLQGLGRPDDPEPSRVEDYIQSEKPKSESKTSDSKTSSQAERPIENLKETGNNDNKKSDAIAESESTEKTEKTKEKLTISSNKKKTKSTTDNTKKSTKTKKREKASGVKDRKAKKQSSFVPALLNSNASQTDINKKATSPHRRALALIQKRQYTAALTILKEEMQQNPGDCHLRYLIAVTEVLVGNYSDAETEYKFVIQNASDPKLRQLAERGLKKLE